MWEQMKRNQRKTLFFWILTGLFFFFSSLILVAYFGPFLEIGLGIPRETIIYLLVAIWLLLSLISHFFGDSLILKISQAKKVDRTVHPQLFNIVEEMKIAATLSVMPDIYILPSLSINAFATGIKPENSTIVVTAGLLAKLNREELQGVIAHETAHILNRDIVLLTFLGALLGSFTIVSLLLIGGFGGLFALSANSQGMNYRAKSNWSNNKINKSRLSKNISESTGLSGLLFYSFLSKTREYLADASAVRLTRNPLALASALEKIDIEKNRLEVANSITAPMYIEAPLDSSATHPPIKKRIEILREMSQGAHYGEYQRAYNFIMDKSASIIPKSALKEDSPLSIKDNSQQKFRDNEIKNSEDNSTLKKRRDKFLDCSCGLKIKIPSDFTQEKLSCPKCGRLYDANSKIGSGFNTRHFKAINFIKGLDRLPVQEVNTLKEDKVGNYYYSPIEGKWDSFLCTCGALVQLSPNYSKGFVKCKSCNLMIIIKSNSKEDSSVVEWVKKNDDLGNYIIQGEKWESFYCECGGLIHLSPNFMGKHIQCKSCDEKIAVKSETELKESEEGKLEEKNDDLEMIDGKLVYQKESEGWQSFSCSCGNLIELSPAFVIDFIKCDVCRRKIIIRDGV